ncbi:MAG: DUF2950 domain-containing protein [Desulfosarcina sp.]|nr:DUF2950 domain-containing protein [Desulfobacterales bacterium]
MVFFENNGLWILKRLLNTGLLILIVAGLSGWVAAEEKITGGKAFDSPQKAIEALAGAVKKDDVQAIISIFGPEGKDIFLSGDPVADQSDRTRFLEDLKEGHRFEGKGPGKAILVLGNEEWPFPIPLVKQGNQWYFDVSAGKQEILDRRIGQNELNVINVMTTYVDAQNEYAAKDLDGDGVHAFASGLRSDPGKKNGLYWPAKEGEAMSPMGPLVADAVRRGYVRKNGNKSPYHGYYYGSIPGQGDHAYGGAYDYQTHGKMILGHALLAYPAKYGISGIMTFMVNQQGVLYEKDLGQETASLAAAITIFDPDKSWNETDIGMLSKPKN